DGIELEGLEYAPLSGYGHVAHAQRTKIPNDQMVKYLAITVSPVILVGAALSAPEWVPAAVVFFSAAAKTPAGKKAVQSTALAFADFLGQLTVNKGDVNKVDMTSIVANYINPFGKAGVKSDVVNRLFQNVFDAAADYSLEDGFKVVGG